MIILAYIIYICNFIGMLSIIILSILNNTWYAGYSDQFIAFLENNYIENIFALFAIMQILSIIFIILLEIKKYTLPFVKKSLKK